MRSTILKIVISVVCITGTIGLLCIGEKTSQEDETAGKALQAEGAYIDAFEFDPKELSYSGVGDIDFLEGVTLEGYTEEDVKKMTFIRIYPGDTLSEKIIQYTAETEASAIRSTRALKLHNYSGPRINVPKEMPAVTRPLEDKLGDLLLTKSEYSVDDGFGNDMRKNVEITCEPDARCSEIVHYTISFENMFGDRATERVKVSISGVPAYLAITEPEVTLSVGDRFDPSLYIVRAEYADGRDALSAVTYSGKVDVSEKGTYEMVYELEGEKLVLIVHVA